MPKLLQRTPSAFERAEARQEPDRVTAETSYENIAASDRYYNPPTEKSRSTGDGLPWLSVCNGGQSVDCGGDASRLSPKRLRDQEFPYLMKAAAGTARHGTAPGLEQGHISQQPQRPILRRCCYQGFLKADARNRTGDPFITSEVLYQLSYVGDSRPPV